MARLRLALVVATSLWISTPAADAQTQTPTTAPAAAPTASPSAIAIEAPERRPFRLGLTNAWWIGFSGELSNPVPAYLLALDVAFPTGRRARYHVEIAFESLNGHQGLRFAPLNIGYAIPVPEVAEGLRLEVELILEVIRAEVLFDQHFAVALSSGFRAQIVASYGPGFVAFSPLGFELRYAYGVEETGITTGGGANWPFLLTLGAEL